MSIFLKIILRKVGIIGIFNINLTLKVWKPQTFFVSLSIDLRELLTKTIFDYETVFQFGLWDFDAGVFTNHIWVGNTGWS